MITLNKTVDVSTSAASAIKLDIVDLNRGSIREVPNDKLKGRRPMVYGDSKNVRIAIRNEGDRGFRVEMVSFESRVNKRAKAH